MICIPIGYYLCDSCLYFLIGICVYVVIDIINLFINVIQVGDCYILYKFYYIKLLFSILLLLWININK